MTAALLKKIIKEAEAQKVDPDFALSVAYQESRFKPDAKSDKDAYGLFQITPPFAKDYKIEDRNNIDENIAGGIRGLKSHLDYYDGDKRSALIAYNAGRNNKYFKTKDIADLPSETVGYLDDIDKMHSLDKSPPPEEPLPDGQPRKDIEIRDRIDPKLAGTVGAGVGLIGGTLQQGKKGVDYISDRKVKAEIQIAKEKAAIESAAKSGELSGDKWNRKVVGSLGPGGDSSTEAAKNYRTQQSLSPEESSKYRTDRSGLIVPNTYEKPPPPPAAPTLAERVAKIPVGLGRGTSAAGVALNKLPMATAPLGLGGMGYMGAEAYNRYQKARELYDMGKNKEALREMGGAGISGIGALGALASMAPPSNPVMAGIKGVGALTGITAPVALQLYDEYVNQGQ